MYNSSIFKIATLLIAVYFLTACVGLGGLSHKQVKVLKSEGFTYTDDEWILEMPSRLLFDTNQFELKSDQQETISDLSQKLLNVKLNKLIVQGHTDNVGDEAYNQQLSQRRANSVTAIMIQKGFNSNNIKILGYGSTKSIADNNSEDGRSENRRVSVVIAQ